MLCLNWPEHKKLLPPGAAQVFCQGQNDRNAGDRQEGRLKHAAPNAFGFMALLLSVLSSGYAAVFSVCFFDKQDLRWP